ncbi:hypothetical protein F5141DRAFT_1102531 [Pisolithus sp. B1]|nr:hypothetical protein F5141DRAFT_1102531 [Pisolithus sp. B1]
MVSTRSGKSAKHTYAERVLSAYSQAQREHRRQSLHIATLRAQVRKTAQERKDKLGPNWASWVGKAVRKLEEQGVLEPIDSSGYVRMTEEGKKALNVARRRVHGSSAGHKPTPEEEDLLWRSISHHFSPASNISRGSRRYSDVQSSRKRKQSTRSRALSRGNGGMTEDERDSEASFVPQRTTPTSKRRRTTIVDPFTLPTPSKPLSRMNKAELKAKVKELQSILFASRTGTPQDDTQLSNEEREHLRKQLHEARVELDVYRRRTAIFGAEDEELTDVEDYGLRSSSVGLLSSPMRDARVTPPTPTPARRSSQMLPRTESGSVIHGVSKQPTPAPSDEERLDMGAGQEMEYTADEGDMAQVADVLAYDRQEWQAVTEGGQVITPDMTPSLHEEHEAGATRVLHDKLASLERLLADKDQRLAGLQSDLARKDEVLGEKEKAIDQLRQIFASKDDMIIHLRRAVANKDVAIADKDGVLSQKDSELSQTHATLVEINGKLRDQAIQLEDKDNIISALRSEVDGLRSVKEVLESQVTAVSDEARAKQEAFEKMRQDYAEVKELVLGAETELNATRDRLRDAEKHREHVDGLYHEALQTVSEMEQTIQRREVSLSEKDKQIADKNTAIVELEGNVQSIAAELKEAKLSMDDLIVRLRTSQTQKVEMETDLRATIDTVRREKDDVVATISVLRTEKATVDIQNEELHGQVVALTHNLREARAESAAAKEMVLGLLGTIDAAESARDEEVGKNAAAKQALGVAQTEAARLREQVHEAKMEIQQVRGELAVNQVALVTEQTTTSILRSDLKTARGELDTVRKTLETTGKELLDTRENAKRAEEEAEELRVAKMASESTIADLKTLYERLKRVQAEWASEVDQKFMSVQSKPAQEKTRRALAI